MNRWEYEYAPGKFRGLSMRSPDPKITMRKQRWVSKIARAWKKALGPAVHGATPRPRFSQVVVTLRNGGGWFVADSTTGGYRHVNDKLRRVVIRSPL